LAALSQGSTFVFLVQSSPPSFLGKAKKEEKAMEIKKGRISLWQWGLALVLVLVLAGVSYHAFASGGIWSTKAPMLQGVAGNSLSGTINGKLYFAGGYTGFIPSGTDRLQVYDPATNTWTDKSPLPIPVCSHACGAIAGKLYVVAGAEYGASWGQQLQVYDSATDTWAIKAHLNANQGMMAVGAIDGKLYVAGGENHDSGNVVNDLQVYDPATDTWTTKAPMPTARYLCAAGVIDGKLYVVGGSFNGPFQLDKLEVYDPVTDTWTTRAPMPTARMSLTVGVINGILYAVGGNNGISILSTVEAYDPVSDTWTTCTSMPKYRDGPSAGVINGVLYVAGGNGDYPLEYPSNTLWAFTLPVINVSIDIKPGEYPNSINLGSQGKVPVAILSTPTFDATQVDPRTVTLAGAMVASKGKGALMASIADVNTDGLRDLVLHFDTPALQLTATATEAVLEGKTYDGLCIRGTDTVRIVPVGKK
jgi:N-acetylneuraminic acid mutarotase